MVQTIIDESLKFRPAKVYIEEEALDYPLTSRILENLRGIPQEVVVSAQGSVKDLYRTRDPISEGKEIMLLQVQRGSFLKHCPGTKNYICCLYQILDLATNCNLDCSYCILQAYLNNPFLVQYVNLDDLFAELEETIKGNRGLVYRIGTGELTDSLSLDHITELSKDLVLYFSQFTNACLELKTKSVEVGNLLDLRHKGRTVISWSLNPDSVISSEELGAPSLDERLEAARLCQEAGYRLGFHFDPLIAYPGWEDEYREVVDLLFRAINPLRIAWISLGALRFPPQMEGILRERFPGSDLAKGELFRGMDGKLRYFRPIRTEIFKRVYGWIKERAPGVFVYLCMESPRVWRDSLGWAPRDNYQLRDLLAQRCLER